MKKSTFIRSLLLCGLSMLLCISMLAGTTFAWFTDEVASGNNIIMAGNLDVELYNGDKQVTGEATDPVFFDGVEAGKWEPGAMAWETFTVKNAGNLALKYTLEFSVTAPTTGVSLAEALKIAVADAEPAARPDPSAYEWQPFASFVLDGKLDLVNATEDTYTLIVWWEPSDRDNDFNMNNENQGTKASVDFSLVLKATQLEAESDSFGSDYDEAAGATQVKTADELVAAIANGGEVALTENITITDQLNVTSDTVIYGNGNTLTYTGSANRVIDVAADTGADLTVKDLTVEINNGYCQRAINYNVPNGNLVLDNVTLAGATKATYGVNLPGKSNGVKVEIVDSDITAHIALNVWGKNTVVNVTDSSLSNYDPTDVEDYATIVLNNDGTTAAEGSVITIIGGTITSKDQNGDPCNAVTNSTATGSVNISSTTEVVGTVVSDAAIVRYKDANGDFYPEFYGCSTLQTAFDKASEDANAVVVLIKDIDLNGARVNVPAGTKVVLDLNGHTLTSMDGGNGNWMAIFIDQGAELTVIDSVGTGEIVSSCYGVYVKQNAKFIMNGGTLTVSGNAVYDMGVVLYSGSFEMNGGTINAKIGVCASNYYKLSDSTLPVNSITVGANATINATAQDFNLCEGASDEATDTVIVDNRA